MTAPIRTFVMGLGQMGRSHALAYHTDPGFEIVGLANRSPVDLPDELRAYPMLADFEAGLALKPDLVSINTYTDSHAELAIRAMEAGAHVFVEKPLAGTVEDAQAVVDAARRLGRKLVVGYILRHHPSWVEFIKRARDLGGPYVFRMNLNQQSAGAAWEIHKRLMQTTSPVVDCGVPLSRRHAPDHRRGARGSARHGPSPVRRDRQDTSQLRPSPGAFRRRLARLVRGGLGADDLGDRLLREGRDEPEGLGLDRHGRGREVGRHRHPHEDAAPAHPPCGAWGRRPLRKDDEMVSMAGEPGHQALCDAEQRFVLDAIREDRDLTRHMDDAVRSLAVVLAADRSMREGKAVRL